MRGFQLKSKTQKDILSGSKYVLKLYSSASLNIELNDDITKRKSKSQKPGSLVNGGIVR